MSLSGARVGQQTDPVTSTGSEFVSAVEGGLWDALNFPLFSVGDHSVTPLLGLGCLLILLIGWIVSATVQKVVVGVFRRRDITDPSVTGTARRLIHYAIMVAAILTALPLIGLDITGLFTAGALAAVALGFALQQILQNFVSGVLLLTERTITPHDVLEVEGRMVKVVDMRIRSTIARTRDEEEIIIPNSTLVQSTVKNFTLRDSLYRLRTQVGVAYESDVDQVFEVLAAAAATVVERDHSIAPAVLFNEFGDSALIFDVSVWVDDPWATRNTRSEMNRAIWRHLRDAGITVAFPQMDVHLDGRVEVAERPASDRSG